MSALYQYTMYLSSHPVYSRASCILLGCLKLWSETIESHRKEVRAAISESTATMAAEGGLRAVTMAKVAGTVGIGRATLYKYFPDVDCILTAWHEEHVAHHL